eukprot:GHVT01041838.1.p1 GENE.GHVT01041838.1~~GHVT01041838.1.p1  ORF type:complete len:134 (+),score=3.02 GHVT01041838.1:290-691(+)
MERGFTNPQRFYTVTGEIAALNGILVINDPKFAPEKDYNVEVPQIQSLVVELIAQPFSAVISGKIYNIPYGPQLCTPDKHHNLPGNLTADQLKGEIKSRKEAADRFEKIFEEHPSFKTTSLIVYATSKQWSRM